MLAIVAFGVPLALNLSARVNAEVRTQAQAQADLVAATAGDLLLRPGALATLARNAAQVVRGRVLIINSSGGVLADSAGPAQLGSSYESRPEIESALAGRSVQVQRSSKTLGKEILATAVPIIHNDRTAGAVRVTQSVDAVHQAVLHAELALALIGLIVLAIGMLAGGVLAAQIGRPLRRLEVVARRVSQGDLTARARVEGSLEQRSLSSSFNEMTDRIARLLAAQREFVADASHQLRTPLTGLRLRLEEAKATMAGGDAANELDAGIREVDRLSHMVDELLLLSRAGERHSTGAPLDLGDLAAAARRRWLPEPTGLGINLETRRDRDPGSVWAAHEDVECALDVLIDNALRYSPSGSTVTIASAPGRIDIHDRGAGITEEDRAFVFDRFHRGSAGKVGPSGHGLGLAIAQEFARTWGGEISLNPRPGGGAMASLTFDRPDRAGRNQDDDFARA